jgi:hypothetical protein
MSSGADGRVVEGRATLFHTKARSAGFKKVPRSPVAHKGKKERKNKPSARYLIDQYGSKGKGN